MTNPSDPSVPFPDNDTARTRRQLRFVKALFKIDDPEVEQALAVIIDRLAAARQPANGLPAGAREPSPRAAAGLIGPSSLPGLTRQSIILEQGIFFDGCAGQARA
jgi:hypothetical protein